jgi:signal transduction histidine kinase
MRRRIVGLTVIAAVVAITLFGAPLAVVVARYLLNDERTELERAANVVALTLAADFARDTAPTTLAPAAPAAEVAFYDRAERRGLGTGPDVLEHEVAEALHGEIEPGDTTTDLVVGVPVVDDGTIVGVVRVSAPRAGTYLEIGLVWLVMAGLGAIAVGVAWLVARRQGARLAGPLEQLAALARRLGDGDFSVRSGPSGIEEIDAVGTALESTAERIGETLDRERAFSADTSHQLRTPLTGLRLGLEAALDTPPERRTVESLAAAVVAGIDTCDRLEQIADDLLALARDTDRGGRLDLAELLGQTTAEWRGTLAGSGRSLRVEVADELPAAAASTAAVRQVVAVLIDNAARHGAGEVRVTARDVGEALAVDVADEGPGIPQDAELFVRRSRTAGGHGIGLALARSLAEAEGGRLVLTRPAPPRFTLLLPVAADDRASAERLDGTD